MRKILFVCFSDDGCKFNHVLMYCEELGEAGHDVKLILDGPATKMIASLNEKNSATAKKLKNLKDRGIFAGLCERASQGCSDPDSDRNVSNIAMNEGIPLISGMNGHASIRPYIDQGFELIVF